MTDSQLHTHARAWLEYKGLDHLLPDPHSHEDIRGLIALYYEGGCRAFARAVVAAFEPAASAVPIRPPARHRPMKRAPRPAPRVAPAVGWLMHIAAMADGVDAVLDDADPRHVLRQAKRRVAAVEALVALHGTLEREAA